MVDLSATTNAAPTPSPTARSTCTLLVLLVYGN